jgi:hypothetical protein
MRVKKSEKLRLTKAYTGWYTDTELVKAGETQCQAEPLDAKAGTTKVMLKNENGQTRITQVMIKGKRALCAF